jgi:hypothetical protein
MATYPHSYSYMMVFCSNFRNGFLLSTWGPTWMSKPLPSSVSWQSYVTLNMYFVIQDIPVSWTCYPFRCIFRGKLVKNCVRIPCSSESHFSRQRIRQQKIVPVRNRICHFVPFSHSHTRAHASPPAHSVPCLPQPVLKVSGAFCYFLCDCVENLLPLLQPWVKSIVVALPSARESVPFIIFNWN